MFQQLRSLFFGSPPLAAIPDDVDDVDAGGQFDNLPADDDSLADRSRKLDYRNWSRPLKYRYLRFADLPPTIRAAADDGTIQPWGESNGESWYRIADPIDDELSALDEIAELDAQADAIVDDFNARCNAMILARVDSFLPHSDWDGSDE